MARLNREFLVPYLRDVCAVELQIIELSEKINSMQNSVRSIYDEFNCGMPYKRRYKAPRYDLEDFCTHVFSVCGLAIVAIVACLIFGWFKSPWCLAVIFGSVPLGIGLIVWGRKSEQWEAEAKYEEEYQTKLKRYNECQKKLEQFQPKIQSYQNRAEEYQRELRGAQDLREKLYSVNVLPIQYRNVYTAVYLYRYFSTCQADDLDAVLQTFVLEEIKIKIDEVIMLEKDSILNQEIMLANQRASIESQEKHQSYMESKARQIAASQEEQNLYLDMIEANTSAAAYFAAASYYK